MPQVRFTRRGSTELAMRMLETPEGRARALEEVDGRCYANTSSKSRESVWLTWVTLAKCSSKSRDSNHF